MAVLSTQFPFFLKSHIQAIPNCFLLPHYRPSSSKHPERSFLTVNHVTPSPHSLLNILQWLSITIKIQTHMGIYSLFDPWLSLQPDSLLFFFSPVLSFLSNSLSFSYNSFTSDLANVLPCQDLCISCNFC